MNIVKELYNLIGRSLFRILTRTFLTRILNDTKRVRAVITDGKFVLLERSWLGEQKWGLPGGGIKKFETAKQALQRELKEEVNLELRENQTYELGWYDYKNQLRGLYWRNQVFVIKVDSKPKYHSVWPGTIDAGWFDLELLPVEIEPGVIEILSTIKQHPSLA